MTSSAHSRTDSDNRILRGAGLLAAGLLAVGAVVSIADSMVRGYTAEASLWVATEEGAAGQPLPMKPWVELLRADAVMQPAWDRARRLHDRDPAHHADVGSFEDFVDRLSLRARAGNLIHLSYRDRTPEGAEDNLESIMNEFLTVSAGLKRNRMEVRVTLLDDQLVAVESELEGSERALVDHYRAQRLGAGDAVENAVTARRLEREMEAAASLYEAVRQRRDAARLELRSSIPDVRVLDRPVLDRDGRQRAKDLVRGLFFLVLAGMIGAGTWLLTGGGTALRRVERRARGSSLALDGATVALVVGAGMLALMLTWLVIVNP